MYLVKACGITHRGKVREKWEMVEDKG